MSAEFVFPSGWQDRLLLTKRAAPVALEPFPYFMIDDYLPAALYQAARASFPAGVETDQYGNRKQVFSQHRHPERVAQFLAGDEVWRALVDFFGSDAYLQDLRRYLGPALGRARGLAGSMRWRRRAAQPVLPLVDRPVSFGYEFSLLEDGAYLYPHTDAPAKLVSLLLYFPPDDWRPEFGGATELYRPKDPRHERNWMNRNLGFDDVELVYRSEFRPNRLFGFVKSANSLHGVAPVTCGPGRLRLSFNFNVVIDPAAAGSRPARWLNELRRRREAPAFAGFDPDGDPQ
jgi:hypothetical protein